MKIENEVYENLILSMKTKDDIVNLLRYTPVYALDLLKKRKSVEEFIIFLNDLDADILLYEKTFDFIKPDLEKGIRHNKVPELIPYYFLVNVLTEHIRGLRNKELLKDKLSVMNELIARGVPVLNITDAFSGAVTLTDLSIIPFISVDHVVDFYKKMELGTPVETKINQIDSLIKGIKDKFEETHLEVITDYDVENFRNSIDKIYDESASYDELMEKLTTQNSKIMGIFEKFDNGVLYTSAGLKEVILQYMTDLTNQRVYNNINDWLEENYSEIMENINDDFYISDFRSHMELIDLLSDLKKKYRFPHLYI